MALGYENLIGCIIWWDALILWCYILLTDVYEYPSFSIRYDISIIIPIKKYILLYNVYNRNKNKNEKYVEFQYLNVNKIYSIWSVSYI